MLSQGDASLELGGASRAGAVDEPHTCGGIHLLDIRGSDARDPGDRPVESIYCIGARSYSGTGFDLRVILSAARRLGLDPSALLGFPHVDLCSLLRRCFIFPHHSYALKEIGSTRARKSSTDCASPRRIRGMLIRGSYLRRGCSSTMRTMLG